MKSARNPAHHTSIKKRHLSMEWHEAANLDKDPIKELTHSF
jgi:hypothetical protein